VKPAIHRVAGSLQLSIMMINIFRFTVENITENGISAAIVTTIPEIIQSLPVLPVIVRVQQIMTMKEFPDTNTTASPV